MSEPLAPRFDPKAIEGPAYRTWLERGYFHLQPSAVTGEGKDPYVIVIPPPNVTAVLHMGHGLNNTIQDVLIRWQRMRGRGALWIPGTDSRCDVSPAVAAGLRFRPLEETIADTLAWHRTRPPELEMRAGLAPEREAEVLAAWRERAAREP